MVTNEHSSLLGPVLTSGPRLTGVPHASSALSRWDTKMSHLQPTSGTSNSFLKNRSSPSFEMKGQPSHSASVVMGGPTLVAGDHDEKCGPASTTAPPPRRDRQ